MTVDVSLASGVFLLLLFMLGGGPMLVVDWSRRRRRQEVARQIALTDALDAVLGPRVAPVVMKPPFGPWEIQLTLPIDQSATVARILSVVDDVFADTERVAPSYRILVTAQEDAWRETRACRAPRSATPWAGHPVSAA
jgi:hypothetical protein